MKPLEVRLIMLTLVIAGACRATLTVVLGLALGSTEALPAFNAVIVMVNVPATVPWENCPLFGRLTVVEPAGMVKLRDVPEGGPAN